MKKILLLFVASTFAIGGAFAQIWNAKATAPATPKLIPDAQFSEKLNKVTPEKMSGLNGFTREGEDEVDYLKYMTYMPGDAEGAYIMNFHALFNGFPQTGKMAVGTVYDYRMVNSFAGNVITELNYWIGPGFSSLKYCIWDAMTQELLWSKNGGLTSGGAEGKSVTVGCDYEVEANRPIIVGYEFTFKDATVKLPIFDNGTVPMGFVVDMTQLGATNGFANLGSQLGVTFYVECLTEGPKSHPVNDVEVGQMFSSRAHAGGEYSSTIGITNWGKAPIYSITYSYFDGEKEVTSTVDNEAGIPFLGKANMPYKATAPAVGGRYDVNLKIKSINGEEDGFAGYTITDYDGTVYDFKDNEASAGILSITNSAVRKVVVEEFTGMWCGWCPSGIVAMDKIEQAYPNDVAVICAHVGDSQSPDAMVDQSYAELSFGVGQYPSALLNRYTLLDPYYGTGNGIEKDVEAMRASACEARMGIASELSDDGKSVNVTAIVEPMMDLDVKDYSLTYVLTEDGVTGYEQTNYFAKEYGEISVDELPEDLKFLATAGPKYKPTFNDVSRLITGVGGIEGSFDNKVFTAGKKVMHNYTITLPSNIANIDNVSVTAILFDATSGEIVTAEKALIGESVFSTGLENVVVNNNVKISAEGGAIQVSGANGEVQVYTAAGQLVSNVSVNGTVSVPVFGAKGTYVVRVVTAEGVTVKKVML